MSILFSILSRPPTSTTRTTTLFPDSTLFLSRGGRDKVEAAAGRRLRRPRRRIELDAKRAYVVAEHFAKLIRGDPADEPGPASQRGYACRSIRRRTARRFPARRHASIEPCRLLCVDQPHGALDQIGRAHV